MEFLKRVYSRLIRLPLLGPLLHSAVRFFKRLAGLPSAQTVDRMGMLQAALCGLKTENERLIKRVETLELEVQRLRQYDHQLTALLEVVEARDKASPAPKRKAVSRSSAQAAKTRTKPRSKPTQGSA